MTAYAIYRQSVEFGIQPVELFICQLHFARPQILHDALFVLRAGNGHDIRIFTEHPSQRDLRWSRLLFCGKTPEHFDNGHIAGYVLPLQLWNPYTHVIDLTELRIRCNFPDKSPLATGENGTKAIPFPTQKGMTSFQKCAPP